MVNILSVHLHNICRVHQKFKDSFLGEGGLNFVLLDEQLFRDDFERVKLREVFS